ncbi:MAG TPA: head GIN domain-containing protein [Chitinophagaceae bacterium]|nr:head GIN domain-containing protein [Chitinophagaceae bacterium]
MKKLIFMLAAAAALLTATSCRKVIGEGDLQTETRNITDFSGVSASIGGKIYYKIDPVYKVEITAQRNILDVIQATKINGHLLLKIKDGVRIKSNEEIIVNISAPTADYFHLSGTGDLMVTGNIIATDIDMSISGTGNLTVSAMSIGNNMKAEISGTGNINVLAGSAKNEELKISGSGKLLLEAVAAENAETKISGSGDIRINVSQRLDATISGSGSVYYHGNPLISADISGSGRVRPL